MKARGESLGNIAIITDSNACIPDETAEEYGVGIVPVPVIFGDEVLLDGQDISTSEFYRRLKSADPLPTTSAPSVGQYQQAFESARESGAEGILAVALSSKLSMAYNAASTAAQGMSDFPINVLDSRLATAAQGFVAIAAAIASARGFNLDQVTAVAARTVDQCGFVAALDTIEHLYRGGRVPAIATLIGSSLKMKPILGNRRDGTVSLITAVRGRNTAAERILNIVERRAEGSDYAYIAVMHSDALERAEDMMEIVAARFRIRNSYIVEFSPVMGAHAGPGVIGLAYQIEEDTLNGGIYE